MHGITSTHEEANTRLVLHCAYMQPPTVVVWCRDIDVLLTLVAHSAMINKEIYMKAGTSKKPKYIHMNELIISWELSSESALALMPFHALTGSDTTLYFAGHTKRKALLIFLDNTELLSQLGKDPLTDATVKDCEHFICKLYNTPEASTTDEAQVTLFKKGIKPELSPQTSNAARLHIMRAHLQAMIWLKAIETKPMIPDSAECWLGRRW